MKLKPLNDRVIVRPKDPESKTPGGIILPEKGQEQKAEGTIVAVGPGKLLENGTRGEMFLKEGDQVVYSKWKTHEIENDGEDLLVMEQDNVLAVIW